MDDGLPAPTNVVKLRYALAPADQTAKNSGFITTKVSAPTEDGGTGLPGAAWARGSIRTL
nr:hypothetical protein [Rhizobium etli]